MIMIYEIRLNSHNQLGVFILKYLQSLWLSGC